VCAVEMHSHRAVVTSFGHRGQKANERPTGMSRDKVFAGGPSSIR